MTINHSPPTAHHSTKHQWDVTSIDYPPRTAALQILAYLFIWTFTIIYSQSDDFRIPDGYYNDAEGLYGDELKTALHNIIRNHNSQSYSSLWTHLQTTDRKPNGKVWDMYSDIPAGTPPYEFTFVNDQCGNYSGEGDCYNREHSWPQSWFNSALPMKTDLFHVYPTDGYVNGQRGNYPYGEVGTISWISENGSKRGSCSYPGYSGTVFEPIDDYKGDFARTFFYMSVRYYTEDSGWEENAMVSGAEIKPWAVDMLIEWHESDPLSQKEVDRNEAVYEIQNNRNPFIDHPEYVYGVWKAQTMSLSVSSGWNMVGLPLNVYDPSYQTVFPTSVNGTLYSYDGQYVSATELFSGEGYWLRFYNSETITISGITINEITIQLREGWNMISGISSEINVNDIIDSDSLIIQSTIYGYNSTYFTAETIQPGKSYWLRSNGVGEIIISLPAYR